MNSVDVNRLWQKGCLENHEVTSWIIIRQAQVHEYRILR